MGSILKDSESVVITVHPLPESAKYFMVTSLEASGKCSVLTGLTEDECRMMIDLQVEFFSKFDFKIFIETPFEMEGDYEKR